MKAGAFTPAILADHLHEIAHDVARSMKAGAFTPAIRPGCRQDVRAGDRRSMKAGAFTPAIPATRSGMVGIHDAQ